MHAKRFPILSVPVAMSDPWEQDLTRVVTNDEAVRRFKGSPSRAAPGEKWEYNNYGYLLLGLIIERVTGMPYTSYLDRELFRRVGMTSTTYCPKFTPRMAKGYQIDERGQIVIRDAGPMNMSAVGPGGSYCSSLRDLLRWQDALVDGRVVSTESYRRMTSPVVLNDGRREPYGYALGIRPVDGHHAISHGGGISGYWSYLSYHPTRDLSIVVLVNSRAEPSRPLAESLARVVLAALEDCDAEPRLR